MSAKIFLIVLGLAVLLTPATVVSQSFDNAEIAMFYALNKQPNDLARYSYLTKVMPTLSASDQLVAEQMLATSENELGLYEQAVFSFPLKSALLADLSLPTTAEWQATDAVAVITKLAADHRIVMINEAHHDAHTRELTLALLPHLRALGFAYFAIEALSDHDPGLVQRGYPIKASGTEYLREPLYGEIVREAIRLGFTIVPYDDAESTTIDARETGQAENLYQKVFAKDPGARLFIHTGYAHIDKAAERLGKIEPMAMRLQALTGLNPLSIDQTQFLEVGLDHTDAYHQLIARFKPKTPVVLINRATGTAWSASPKLYDVNVILPPALSLGAFGEGDRYGSRTDGRSMAVSDPTRFSMISPTLKYMERPNWLTLDGQRIPFPINSDLCRTISPCVIEANYINEPDDATAADRYAFMEIHAASSLYLRPGHYRLRAVSKDGRTLSEQDIEIAPH